MRAVADARADSAAVRRRSKFIRDDSYTTRNAMNDGALIIENGCFEAMPSGPGLSCEAAVTISVLSSGRTSYLEIRPQRKGRFCRGLAARFASLGSRIYTRSGAFRRKSGDRKASLHNRLTRWRRGWDSNPRYGCPYAAFRVRCFRPLSHLSAGFALAGRGAGSGRTRRSSSGPRACLDRSHDPF